MSACRRAMEWMIIQQTFSYVATELTSNQAIVRGSAMIRHFSAIKKTQRWSNLLHPSFRNRNNSICPLIIVHFLFPFPPQPIKKLSNHGFSRKHHILAKPDRGCDSKSTTGQKQQQRTVMSQALKSRPPRDVRPFANSVTSKIDLFIVFGMFLK